MVKQNFHRPYSNLQFRMILQKLHVYEIESLPWKKEYVKENILLVASRTKVITTEINLNKNNIIIIIFFTK